MSSYGGQWQEQGAQSFAARLEDRTEAPATTAGSITFSPQGLSHSISSPFFRESIAAELICRLLIDVK